MAVSSEVSKTVTTTAICASPIGSDLVALSAFDTLVRKMGYEDALSSLSREELWILSFELGDIDAGNVTKMLAEKTGIFVNPNTHTHLIVLPNETLPHGARHNREELCIDVWSVEDPQIDPVTVAVRERMGVLSLKVLKRLTRWWPRFAKCERGEGREIALSMVPTYSRKQGLLANPHYQCWSIIDRGLRPEELLRTTCEIEQGRT